MVRTCQLCGAKGTEGFWMKETTGLADGRLFPTPLRYCFCADCTPKKPNDRAAQFMVERFVEAVHEHFPDEHRTKTERPTVPPPPPELVKRRR